MTEMIKVGLLGIVGVLIAVQFKAQKPEYGTFIGLAIGILVFCYVLKELEVVMGQFDLVRKYLGSGEGYLAILLKVIGITYIWQAVCDVCRNPHFVCGHRTDADICKVRR